jgi:WD40 repeat protein
MVASAQEGKNSIIRIWDYYTARCISMVTMPVSSLKCVAFSPDGRLLACVGKDSHNKEMITIWDISKVHRGEVPEIAARQTSEFNILCLKFSPIDNCRLVSCGKENIRFWRVRETNNIRGSAVVLNHHARNTVFTSLDFEWGATSAAVYGSANHVSRENASLKRVYVASKHGMIYQINYATEALERTYRTNDSAIYTIAVNEEFCVTGSEDKFLRVWPLDFCEFLMEAKHEGTVCQVEISTDHLRVVCGTLYGSLGILDKSNQRYRTLIRSHHNAILSMDFHVPKRNIITVSSDNTIRLWDLQNYDQAVEFSSPID